MTYVEYTKKREVIQVSEAHVTVKEKALKDLDTQYYGATVDKHKRILEDIKAGQADIDDIKI